MYARARASVHFEHTELVIPFGRLARRGPTVPLVSRVFYCRRLIKAETSRHHFGSVVTSLEGHHAGCYHDESYEILSDYLGITF